MSELKAAPHHHTESKARRIVWLVLFLTSVAGLCMMAYQGARNREYVSCNAGQVDILIRYQRETSIAAREERAAHDVVRRSQLSGDAAAQRNAIEKYFEVRRAADARRAAVKLPELPETVCGKDPN